MVERRMFAKSIVLSDAFLDMPMSARCLYFTLGMLADDDGFVGSPKSIMRQCGASQDDMSVLLQKRYVLGFESGVIVIKHWRMNNYLRNDRYQQTTYLEEKNTLKIDDKGAYTEAFKVGIPSDNQMDTNGIPSIGKDSIGKDSIDILSGENSDNEKMIQKVRKVINYLNEVLGTKYTDKNKSNVEKIKARFEEGHTFEDFKKVIDTKFEQWGNDPKMNKYLRPETLFRASHFESYLNERKDNEPVGRIPATDEEQRNREIDEYHKRVQAGEFEHDDDGLWD